MKHKTAALILAALLILWLSAALIRVENERYAMLVGMCRDPLGMTDITCLSRVETRTGWWWHLFYALTD